MFIPDFHPNNPSSKATLVSILQDYKNKLKIETKKQWVFIVCDSALAYIIRSLKLEQPKEYEWVILLLAFLYEEMNIEYVENINSSISIERILVQK